MMLQKHTLITAALLASLALSACGKKTDVMNPPAPESKKEGTLDGQESKPNTDDESDDTNGSLGGGLPPQQGQEDEEEFPPTNDPSAVPVKTKPSPSPSPKKADKVTDIPGAVPAPAPKTTTAPKAQPSAQKPVQQTEQTQREYPQPPQIEEIGPVAPTVSNVLRAPVGENQLPDDYSTDDVNNLSRDGVTKRLTGGVTKDGYVYTSASTDELLNFLRKRNERVGAESRRQNLAAAASVVSAKMSQEGFDGESAVFTLKVQEAGAVKVYNLAGGLSDGRASKLRLVNSGNGERTTGAYNVAGTAKCLDLDGGCETVMTRLEIGNGVGFGVAYVVFRNSKADLYFHLPAVEKYSGNPEFHTLSDYFISTIKDLNTRAKIQKRTLSSWEVVNGRSGFTFTTKGYNDELLAFSGPLLSQDGSNAVNVRLNRVGKDQDNSLDLIAVRDSKLNYANTIQEARLIANNGLGQIRLSVKMRKRNNYAQDRFAVSVMKTIKPIVDLEDDNLK